MNRDNLENWVIKSIKPIGVSCEPNIFPGMPDWQFNKYLIELMPIWMFMLVGLAVYYLIVRLVKKV
jgi:hypothetical protein